MRVINLADRECRIHPTSQVKTCLRRRPTTEEQLLNSIIWIKRQKEYLAREGILVQTGPRTWRMRYRQ
jgi:hypothetical protein